MCGDPYGFMCDECFGKMMSALDQEQGEMLCKECNESARKYWEEDEQALELEYRKESANDDNTEQGS